MPKLYISNEDKSVRMFNNDFLDAFSRIHWSVPLYIYIPVIIYFLYLSFTNIFLTPLTIIALFAFGIFVWTLIEYILHRFVFHYEPKTEFGKRVHFIFHGVHHDYPRDSKRLVMVPTVSIPLAIFFYFLSLLTFGEFYSKPFFAGLVLGYLIYDMMHYALHHFAFKNKLFLELKKHHMRHHYSEPDKAFGVSSPFWDFIFGTISDKRANN